MTEKKTFLSLLAVLIIAVLSVLIFTISAQPIFAAADTEVTRVYKLTFDYEYYRVYSYTYSGNFPYTAENWPGNGQYSWMSAYENVTSVSIMHGTSSTKDFEIMIYGEVPNENVDKEVVPKGNCFNFKIINIKVPAICQGAAAGALKHDYRYRISQLTNSNGEMLVNEKFHTKWSDQGPEVIYSGALPEGTYTLHFEYSNWSNDWIYYHRITTTFSVDRTPPTISGASTSTTGLYTNKTFTVTASDPQGISKLYYKSPLSSSYSYTIASSKTIYAGSANGRYEFYAEDVNGNKSSTYYVNFDDVPPTLQCVGAGFGGAVNGNFVVIASDNMGSVTLYYKLDDGNWNSSGTQFATDRNSQDGVYRFYAVDRCGNKSDEVWVEALILFGEFIKSDSNNSVYFTWDCPSWEATLDGNNYSDGDWITEEGKHTVKLSSASNTALYSYTIEHYYVEEITTSTCTEAGYTVFECNQCGDSYTTYATEELGHYYVASTVAPTCTSGGYTKYTCTRCGDYYTDNYTNALGHNYKASATAATCTTSGTVSYTCTRCGTGYSNESAKPLGHSYVEVTVAAACEEGGYTLHQCSRCGSSYKDNVSQPLGHNFDVSTTPPTCTEYGKTHYECQVCGFTKDECDGTYPTGHSYTVTIITEPTCTTEGTRKSTCDNCGHSFETKIPANGHNYVIADVTESNGETTRIYTCTICGHSYKQTLGNQYEEVSNYVDYLFDQYAPYMWWVLLASAGVWSIVMGVFFAIAQKNEDKEKARRMIINYIIGIVVIAVIVVAAPYLIRGIASLV